FLEQLSALKADLFLVIAIRMLPRDVWQMPELGTFNIHGSLLPNYRGAAPINWALINGEQKTGVTSFFINEEIDSGSLISNIEVDIADEDNAGTLHDKLMHSASSLVLETLDLISQGNANETKQILDGEEKAAPKIYKEDCLIDWNKPGAEIHNFIRGLSPYPVAWSKLRTESKELGQLRIYKAQFLSDVKDVEFGKVQITKSSMFIGLKDGTLELQEIQWPGKRKMDVKSFLNGFKFEGNLSVLGN
ncbi:MAG: formyltransferase family protein, partial [Schleiferiaceae bacterium]|nr:formyltransferase family protein [Schleiferiaceae bacterium]